MKNRNGLTTEPVRKLIRQIALPAGIGMMFNTFYNIVDTWYGGQISTQALAAMTLSFPVFFTIIAIGSGVSSGAAALISNALGAGDLARARAYSAQSAMFSILAGVVLTVLGWILSPLLFRVLGASGAYLSYALEYTDAIFAGTVLFMLTFVFSSILSAEGNTVTYRNLLIIGFFLNLALDPWFIRGGFGVPAMGLAGVAWATVLIQAIVTAALLHKLIRSRIFGRESLGMAKPRKEYFIEIARQGFPASLNMMAMAIGIFIITLFVSRFGPEAVAAFGIAARFDQIALLPILGLNIAALSLVGQNNGARLFGRVREITGLSYRYAFLISAISMLVVIGFAGKLVNLFSQDPNVVVIGAGYLRISALVYMAYASLYITVSVMQGLKKPDIAVWIAAWRQIAAPLILFWIADKLFGLDLHVIWWGIFIANWSAAVWGVLFVRSNLSRLETEAGIADE